VGNRWYTAYCLEGLAGVAAVRGEAARAARLFGAAEALRERVGAPLTPTERSLYEGLLAAVLAGLDPHAFAEVWADGRALPLDTAVALARGESTRNEVPAAA
jgi:hypothetical protein